MTLQKIQIKNFKSIKEATLSLQSFNLLLGANGAGKSNFVQFFQLVKQLYDKRLQVYVVSRGKADSFLHHGSQYSDSLSGGLVFKGEKDGQANTYQFKLIPSNSGNLIIETEQYGYKKAKAWKLKKNNGLEESQIGGSSEERNQVMKTCLNSLKVYHFHDTSRSSKLKQSNKLKDNRVLREDGSNLAAILYRIQQKSPFHLKLIVKTIQSVTPFFESFDLKPDVLDDNYIDLVWREKSSNKYFNAHDFSDGTLRFIALATLLLQPDIPPIVIIDEPELGLHPFAIDKLAALLKNAASRSQLIVSTQSVNLISHFEPRDVIVVDRKNGASEFKRLENEALEGWLEDYSLGEIWEKNIIGGRPA